MANSSTKTWSMATVSVLIAVVCAVVGSVVIVVVFGRVSGEEFNPLAIQRRRFYFFEIPVVQWQVYPLVRSKPSEDLEEFLVDQKYLTPRDPRSDRWDLVRFQRSLRASPPFDASILTMYLEAREDRYGLFWRSWSNANPELAKVFWPHVMRLARANLYVVLPHFFELARTASNARELDVALTSQALKRIGEHATRAQAARDDERAVELFSIALEVSPGDAFLLNQRAAAYRSLGKTAEAEADELAAKQAAPTKS